MKLMWLFAVVGLIFTGCSDSKPGAHSAAKEKGVTFSAYSPGQRVSASNYNSQITALEKTFSLEALEQLNAQVDWEAIEALNEVFSHRESSETSVQYGAWGITMDGANALRVVWKRHVPSKKIDISIMTFWKFENGKFLLKGGTDSIRLRTTVDPSEIREKRSVWISYEVDMSNDGSTVKALRPGVYQLASGDMKPGIPSQAQITRCASCHYHGMLRGDVPEHKITLENSGLEFGIQQALKTQTIPSDVAEAVLKPRKTFFPNGILEALKARHK